MNLTHIKDICKKHDLIEEQFTQSILLYRKKEDCQGCPGQIPDSNCEIFDIRKKNDEWEVWSFLDKISNEGTRIYTLCFGAEIDMDEICVKIDKRIKELREINNLNKIENDFK
jgi:hypothetical protein